jgi:hypothetical protein
MSETGRLLHQIRLHTLFLVSGLLLGRSLWAHIALPFSNPHHIVGPLPLQGINPANNTARFLVFIAVPSLLWLMYTLGVRLWAWYRPEAEHRRPPSDGPHGFSVWGVGALSILIGFITIETLRTSLMFAALVVVLTLGVRFLPRRIGDRLERLLHPPETADPRPVDRRLFWGMAGLVGVWGLAHLGLFFVQPLDMKPLDLFHEGEQLAPAYNWVAKRLLWSVSFFAHGAFYDPVSTLLGWELFGQPSIGASRVIRNLLIAAAPACFALFLLMIGLAIRRFTDALQAGIAVGLIAVAYMVANSLQIGLFKTTLAEFEGRRDTAVLCGLALLVFASLQQKRKPGVWFLLGLVPPLSIYNAIDRGLYVTAILVSVMAVQWALAEDRAYYARRLVIPFLMGLSAGCTGFLAYYGWGEIRAFITELLFAVRYWDYLHGLPYPEPGFTPGKTAWETTIPMVLIAFQLYVMGLLFPRFIKQRAVLPATVSLIFLLTSLTYFRTALGRVDPGHIPLGAVLVYSGFAYAVWMTTPAIRQRLRYPLFGALAVIALFYTAKPLGNVVGHSGDLLTFPSRLQAYVSLPDIAFLDEKTRAAYPRMLEIFKDQPCTYVHTNDAAWHYLLRKPSCGRFIFTWYASTEPHQHELIRDLETHKPRYILYECTYPAPVSMNVVDGIDNLTRVPMVEAYIRTHYEFAEAVDAWRIYRRKEADPGSM